MTNFEIYDILILEGNERGKIIMNIETKTTFTLSEEQVKELKKLQKAMTYCASLIYSYNCGSDVAFLAFDTLFFFAFHAQ